MNQREYRELLARMAEGGTPFRDMIDALNEEPLSEDDYGALWLFCWALCKHRERRTTPLSYLGSGDLGN
jgi:hypothetical protein